MEDDSSARVNVTEQMPGYTGRDGASLHVSSGIRSTDFGRDVRSEPKVPASSLLLSSKDVLEFHKHKHESGGNNKESHERESIRAVDILRRNCGDPEDPEKVETGFEIEPEDSDHEEDEERMQCSLKPNLEDPELADPDGNLNIDCKRGEELKEHVYCTVYCIANDNYRIPVDKTSDYETTSQSPSSSSDVLVSLPTDSDLSDREPYPVPYTVSDLMMSELNNSYNANNSFSVVLTCRICLDDRHIMPLHCCKKAVCEECLKRYVSSQVHLGRPDLVCPITECSGFLEESLVISHLSSEELTKYKYFLELSRLDSSTKPCPQCSLFTSLKGHGQQTSTKTEHKYKIQCATCQFVWCFKCHSPWHEGLKCRDYKKGDKLLRNWASVIEHGQRNAQKCPRCKIHIQKMEGCDHMSCTQCNTNFCYRCGEKYRHLRFFGDHTSNLSVFGCKYRYLPEKPHLRRLVRGSVCMSKLLVAPVLIILVVIVGALALVIGLFALPVYYICKRRRKHTQGSGRWLC
ncbi:probable E3 ubiquitin-protein ligase RNF217 [Triplophysa rosa]|uniref:E3 ubiquitin-protein ligase RNF217 n=1 Tax=Triplophysa rosa TaxID=992332 RepID=A0A9W7TLQ1_TRIRA|nr:probable E3 ubiquitin-protein ligase RNF217 [Triplophysa rosa]KAI7799490.1 putative E3 ubiquitin-protein ligase RNF217 [Triplophysa rosa]